jgi:predicted AAA+ superfamily ATPase
MIAQVSFELNNDNFSREISGLIEAMDELKSEEGFIFTFNQEDQIETEGKIIHVVPLWKWMNENK